MTPESHNYDGVDNAPMEGVLASDLQEWLGFTQVLH